MNEMNRYQDESHKSISCSYNIPKLKSNSILNEENQAYFEDLYIFLHYIFIICYEKESNYGKSIDCINDTLYYIIIQI